ncbi:thiamine-phosphate kinase [Bacterioplanoides sp. SCSIO 12839]|uniref:thiamine-phosphate kinase n=1 Tax=Bacterioplanoides sp. SCSIO 12839 TaxID=2829569 RepID=UPI002106DC74|nr:thiamine-phosphate kinase [Bacterioplanoides sp. SCSIO 12839]UTW47597.1 thiamine-phosphate kinase [Bacterioplanoides sp. SCSIO 12839]
MSKKTTDTSSNRIGEFELIRRFFCSDFPSSSDTVIAIGDDASVIKPPANTELVQSIDTQVADVHFPATAPAHLIAQRALRCAVSDLAAMGANPQGFHLALTLPESDADWLKDFSDSLKKAAHELNIALMGGDTTRGKQLVISVAVQGWVALNQHGNSQALTRSGAQAGDAIYCSGPIGAAALALPQVLHNPADISGFAQAYYFPQVHLSLGQQLLNIASSCMDISDGLLQDAGHIARSSELVLEIDPEKIQYADPQKKQQCLTGGDDYQLLFTSQNTNAIAELQQQFPTIHQIGVCKKGPANVILTGPFSDITATSGFSHF